MCSSFFFLLRPFFHIFPLIWLQTEMLDKFPFLFFVVISLDKGSVDPFVSSIISKIGRQSLIPLFSCSPLEFLDNYLKILSLFSLMKSIALSVSTKTTMLIHYFVFFSFTFYSKYKYHQREINQFFWHITSIYLSYQYWCPFCSNIHCHHPSIASLSTLPLLRPQMYGVSIELLDKVDEGC